MMTRYLNAWFAWLTVGFALLAALSVHAAHAAEPAPAAKMGTYYGGKATEYPAWFKDSFLQLKEDIAETRKNGKRVIVMFTQDGCPYFSALVERNLSQREIEATMRQKFDVIAVKHLGHILRRADVHDDVLDSNLL